MARTFVIAEAGINHKGELGLAKALVEAAKESGADAIKFQTYTTETRVLNRYVSSEILNILKGCEMPFEWHAQIKEHADKVGIEFFSTPFDISALKFLVEDLKLRRVKIASFDINNIEFLRAVNEYAKQFHDYKVVLSTGMSAVDQISSSLRALNDVSYLTLLHCKSSYPLVETNANLAAIRSLQNNFHMGARTFGYSDHTSGITIPSLAILAGATTIEKHFTLDQTNGAVDNPVSADPRMFSMMVNRIRLYEEILGSGELKLEEFEKGAVQFQRHSGL